MTKQPVVLSIAGSDPSGGAGIQADLQTFAILGVRGATAITALTVQTPDGVKSLNAVAPQIVTDQIDAAFAAGPIDAVKVGMLANAAIVRAVIRALGKHGARNVVVDPVITSSSGSALLDAEGVDVLRRELAPHSTIITPNAVEAGVLLGRDVPRTIDEMKSCAQALASSGIPTVVITGGHSEIVDDVVDVLWKSDVPREIRTPRVAGDGIHGSGCRYSAALAAALARGAEIHNACAQAQRFVAAAIREQAQTRPALGQLYLVATPRAHWNGFEFLARLRAAVDGGVDVLQLRSKELDGGPLLKLAERVKSIAVGANIPFIINDRVDVAAAVEADGIHLGQKDLAPDLARLIMPRGILGRSSHEPAHAQKALQERADYFAVGPVWETPTKPGRKAAGLKYVSDVRAMNVDIPWYAIGGINAENIHEVIEAGARRVAVVRAVLDARDPAIAAAELKAALNGAPKLANEGVA